MRAVLRDAIRAFSLVRWVFVYYKNFLLTGFQVYQRSSQRELTAWLYVPIGLMTILGACFGVESLIGLSSISFPASVAMMLFLLASLLLCQWVLGERRTRAILKIVDVPVCTSLRTLCTIC